MDSNNRDTEMLEALKEQNRLLTEQNRLLNELVSKTPDRSSLEAQMDEQTAALSSIQKSQKLQDTWSWIKFALIAVGIIILAILLIKVWIYFKNITNTFSQYFESISSAFGKLQGTFDGLQGFFENFGNLFKF